MKEFYPGDAFRFSLHTSKKYPLLILLPAFGQKAIDYTSYSYLKKMYNFLPPHLLWWLLLFFLILAVGVISTVVSIGHIRLAIYAFNHEDSQIKWSVFGSWKLRIMAPLTVYYLLLWMITFLDKKLLMIPLCTLLIIFLFAIFVLVEQKVTVLEAFRLSTRLTSGIWFSLILYYLVCFVLILVTGVTLGFLSYWGGQFIFSLIMYLYQSATSVFFLLSTVYIYKVISQKDTSAL